MTRINPEKLRLSKWTAVRPQNREKHFIVIDIDRDDDGRVCTCTLEAVHSGNTRKLDWHELRNSELWLQGWQ